MVLSGHIGCLQTFFYKVVDAKGGQDIINILRLYSRHE